VKNLRLQASTIAVVAGLLMACGPVQGQAPNPADSPHRIALIDMARVFKQYKKFENLREELKAELQKSEEQFKGLAEQIRKQQNDLKGFKEGTDEFSRTEKNILALTTKAETYRKSAQRDLIRREAQIYKTVYLEVADVVQKYASHFNYTLVLRFSADDVEVSENPEDVMRGLNRQVVYYRPSDDITNAIVGYLNKHYQPQSASHSSDSAPSRN